MTVNVIYIGDHFYFESGTMMSCIYTEDGRRMDWGFVQCALRDGQTVNIRPATQVELDGYEAKLSRLKRERERETAATGVGRWNRTRRPLGLRLNRQFGFIVGELHG